MVKVVEGGQCAATRARFSPGVRTGLHLEAAEAPDTPRPIAIDTAKTNQSFFKFPLLLKCSLTTGSTIIAALNSAPILVVFAPCLVRISENSGKAQHLRIPLLRGSVNMGRRRPRPTKPRPPLLRLLS